MSSLDYLTYYNFDTAEHLGKDEDFMELVRKQIMSL